MMNNVWDISMVIILLLAIAYFAIIIYKAGGLDNMLKTSSESVFKQIMAFTTLADIIVLVMTANAREVPIAAAAPRFIVTAIVEILLNYYFVTKFTDFWQFTFWEGEVNFKYSEKNKGLSGDAYKRAYRKYATSVQISNMVMSAVFFIFSFIGTYIFWLYYLESNGNILITLEGISLINIEHIEGEKDPELSAFVMIWASTFLEIFVAFVTSYTYLKLTPTEIRIQKLAYEAQLKKANEQADDLEKQVNPKQQQQQQNPKQQQNTQGQQQNNQQQSSQQQSSGRQARTRVDPNSGFQTPGTGQI